MVHVRNFHHNTQCMASIYSTLPHELHKTNKCHSLH